MQMCRYNAANPHTLFTRMAEWKEIHRCVAEVWGILHPILKKDELGLRGSWSLHLPQHGLWKAPGVWTGLNYYVNGNHYGPFVLEFPLSILNGKHFMVFRRTTGRQRHFFVQYEAHIPIYSFGTTLWRSVNPFHYFENAGVGAIWDIILTEPIPIDDASINPV